MANSLYQLLVIEDNDADVYLIKKALRDHGIPVAVTVCADGHSAAEAIANPHEPPDAVILDLALPQVDGLDLLRSILNRPSMVGTPVMVFTSSPSPGDRHRVELLGGVRYVQKPSGLSNFLRTVSENVNAMLAGGEARVQTF